ncbi:MAG: DMT family transporter [Oscillospiraceae bacterium]
MAEQKRKRLSRLNKAILFLITSAFFFALMNMFVRLSGDVPTIQKTFFRNFFALFIASGAMIKNRCSIIPPKGARFDLFMRAACGYAGVVLNFYAIDRLSISDASLLNKMSPFFAIIFSTFLLKERANKVQWAIILTAFIGALFVIKPSFQNAELGASIAGFCGGMCAGAAYTFVRRATGKGVKSYYVVFFFSAFSTLVAFPLMLLDFKPMTLVQTLMLVGSGVSAAIAQFCITTAYSYAPAKEVSIYDYSQIIFAALIGFVVLNQVPDVLSFVGYAVIIAAAFVMFRYNNRKTKE